MENTPRRHFQNAGILRYQGGYIKKDGTPVKPHFKTYPGRRNKKDNRATILGY